MLARGVGGFLEVEGGIDLLRGIGSIPDRGFDVLDGQPQGHDGCPRDKAHLDWRFLGHGRQGRQHLEAKCQKLRSACGGESSSTLHCVSVVSSCLVLN